MEDFIKYLSVLAEDDEDMDRLRKEYLSNEYRKLRNEEKEIFIVNGGFVGFISNEGETQYELSYFTPNLKEGLIIFMAGFMLLIALTFVYKNKKVSIVSCENQIAEAYFKKQEEIEKKELAEFNQKLKKFLNNKRKDK